MIARFFRAEQLDRIERSLGAAIALLENLSRKVATMAHEQDDLAAAVAKLTTTVSTAVDEIKAETVKILDEVSVHEQVGIDPAAVEDAADNINSLAARLSDAVSSARSALSPAPPAPADSAPAPQPATDQPVLTA
jgi:division protein CdvB (Snf7/Vps24/ESCRT-III family)